MDTSYAVKGKCVVAGKLLTGQLHVGMTAVIAQGQAQQSSFPAVKVKQIHRSHVAVTTLTRGQTATVEVTPAPRGGAPPTAVGGTPVDGDDVSTLEVLLQLLNKGARYFK